MRLWSVHPRYLDRQGLTAAWREGLLAQKVLSGATRGYRNHPQLQRFRAVGEPEVAIAGYLEGVLAESVARGYSFEATKIVAPVRDTLTIPVADGQLAYEWAHLRAKLAVRSPAVLERWVDVAVPDTHSLFTLVPGPVADWEIRTVG